MGRECTRDDETELLQEATDWDEQIASGDPEILAAFAAWIRASPEHLRMYLVHLTIEVELNSLRAGSD